MQNGENSYASQVPDIDAYMHDLIVTNPLTELTCRSAIQDRLTGLVAG